MTEQESSNEETIAGFSPVKFLETVPPGETRQLAADAFDFPQHGYPTFTWPPIELYCSNTTCIGFRFADPGVKSAVEFHNSDQERPDCGPNTGRNGKSFLSL